METLRIILRSLYRAGITTVIDHDGIEHAGYLAFLGLLSLFPFLVFLVALAGVVGEDLFSAEMIAFFTANLPPHVIDALLPRIAEITTGPSQGLLTVAILGAIWTSSSAVEGVRTVLNRAYQVHTPPAYLFRRLLSIMQLVLLTVIVIFGMALLVVWPILWDKIQYLIPFDIAELSTAMYKLSYIIGILLLFFVISSLYYVIPNVKQKWVSVFPGAAVAVLGWTGSAQLFAFYLTQFDQVNIIYGSLGGIIATLLFFYIIAVIFIYGAEFSYQLRIATGERIIEKERTANKDT